MQTIIESNDGISSIAENQNEAAPAGNSFSLKMITTRTNFFSRSAKSEKKPLTIKMIFHESTNFRWVNAHDLMEEW